MAKKRVLDFNRLGALLAGAATLSIAASAVQTAFEWRDVTGEDILAITQRVGGTVDPESLLFDEHGIITEIRASIPTAYEYDYDEMTGVIDSLYATGDPKKLLGDLAQTSVLTNDGQTQVVGLAEWTIDWKRKTADSTTTDDAAYAGNTGSTKSWSVKAKYMFISGDTSQNAAITSALTNTDDGKQTWNFFPTVEQGREVWQGRAIIDGITWGSGIGKVLGMDVSMTGDGPLKILAQVAPIANPNTATGQTAQVATS